MKFPRLLISAFLLILAFLFQVQTALAKENSLIKGKWALQFQIQDDFSLRSFQGSNLSFKKHTSDKACYRVGISITASFADSDRDDVQNDSISSGLSGDQIGHGVQISLQRVIYPNPKADINLYYGLGPNIGYTYNGQDETTNYSSGNSRYVKVETTQWNVGGSAVLGVEWFITKDFSLSGEYNNSMNYSKTIYDNESVYRQSGVVNGTTSKTSRDSFSFTGPLVRLGLSVYF